MKRCLLVVMMFGGIGCVGVEPTPAKAPPVNPVSSPAPSDVTPDQVSRAVDPNFVACADDEICTSAEECEEMGGSYGGPRCAGWNVCCGGL